MEFGRNLQNFMISNSNSLLWHTLLVLQLFVVIALVSLSISIPLFLWVERFHIRAVDDDWCQLSEGSEPNHVKKLREVSLRWCDVSKIHSVQFIKQKLSVITQQKEFEIVFVWTIHNELCIDWAEVIRARTKFDRLSTITDCLFHCLDKKNSISQGKQQETMRNVE